MLFPPLKLPNTIKFQPEAFYRFHTQTDIEKTLGFDIDSYKRSQAGMWVSCEVTILCFRKRNYQKQIYQLENKKGDQLLLLKDSISNYQAEYIQTINED